MGCRYIRYTLYRVFAIYAIRYTGYSLYPVCVKSGIRYIRFALNRVCAKKTPKGDPLASNEFVSNLNILKGERGNIGKFSKKRYNRNSLYTVFVKSGVGCVIVEGDSLAVFRAQTWYVDCQKGHCQQLIKPMKSATSSV